jgi:hypothetical protein
MEPLPVPLNTDTDLIRVNVCLPAIRLSQPDQICLDEYTDIDLIRNQKLSWCCWSQAAPYAAIGRAELISRDSTPLATIYNDWIFETNPILPSTLKDRIANSRCDQEFVVQLRFGTINREQYPDIDLKIYPTELTRLIVVSQKEMHDKIQKPCEVTMTPLF